jgi:hypothetical protein
MTTCLWNDLQQPDMAPHHCLCHLPQSPSRHYGENIPRVTPAMQSHEQCIDSRCRGACDRGVPRIVAVTAQTSDSMTNWIGEDGFLPRLGDGAIGLIF